MGNELKKVLTRAEKKEIRRKLVGMRKDRQNKFGKFKFTKGAGTKPGDIHTVRLITKDHSEYGKYFNEDGTRKEITTEGTKEDNNNV
jgi:hypothetical protein